MFLDSVFQIGAYPVKQGAIGHAVIVNNVAATYGGSAKNAQDLKECFQELGFTVHHRYNCTDEVRWDLA